MKTIEIIFTKSKKVMPIASWLIRLWTGKPYSHVAMKRYIRNLPMYFQASEGKVNLENEFVFFKKHEIVRHYKLDVPKEIFGDVGTAMMQNAGMSYGFLQNIGIMYVDLMLKMGKQVENPFKGGRNCSELIAIIVIQKLLPQLEIDPDKIKPHEVEDIILKYLMPNQN